MKNAIAIFCAACLARAALAVTMASQPWTTNRIAEATNALVIAAVDLSTSNALLVATIEAVAPVPGNYANVSNAAMIAGRVATNYTDAAIAKLSQTNPVLTGGPYLQTSSNELDHTVRVQYGTGPGGFTFSPSEIYVPGAAFFDSFWIASNDNRGPLSGIGQYGGTFSSARSEMETYVTSSLSGYATHAQVASAAVAATNYTDAAISTNNAAFVSAVLAVPIAGADAGDLTEIAEYGGYGTVGAAVLALIAGLAALKRRVGAAETALAQKLDGAAEYPAWVEGDPYAVDVVVSHNGRIWKSLVTNFDEPGTDQTKWVGVLVGDLLDGKQDALTSPQLAAVDSGVTAAKVTTWDALPAQVAAKQDALSAAQLANIAAVPGKMPMYPMVAVVPSSGTLSIAPYTVATCTAGTTAAAFTVAVGAGTTGNARDCELVIDCTATGAVAPTVTWPSSFHPRTNAGTDFACEAGVRNVYYISEYATGEFAVGGWQETAGGNA